MVNGNKLRVPSDFRSVYSFFKSRGSDDRGATWRKVNALNPRPMYYSQVRVDPPTFLFHVNNRDLMHFSYERYLENQIRDHFSFLGTPLRMSFRNREREDRSK